MNLQVRTTLEDIGLSSVIKLNVSPPSLISKIDERMSAMQTQIMPDSRMIDL